MFGLSSRPATIDHRLTLAGTIPPAVLDVTGLTWSWGKPRWAGQPLAFLGNGTYGSIFAHPTAPAAVIKFITNGIGHTARREQCGLDAESSAQADRHRIGPRFFVTGTIGTQPFLIKERIYGDTLAELLAQHRFGREEAMLMTALVHRMAGAGLMAVDARLANFMIGRTLDDLRPRAYCTDPHRFIPLKGGAAFARTALLAQPIVIHDYFSPYVGYYAEQITLGELLERRTLDNGAASGWRFFRGLAHLRG